PSAAARGLVAPAAACDQRSLVRTASACIDSTEMPLEVQIVKGPSAGDAQGQLTVVGYRFERGRLTLSIAGALLTAQLSPQGVASKVEVTVDGRARDAAMVRLAAQNPG
ncbi:MAG: hypothetical protein K8M05_34940, partial [Deltaproteobacteria bacterium]|nr:hypothetical protein [Kofleriaceae bacterium]